MLLNHFPSNMIIVIHNGLIPSKTVSNVLAGTKHFFCVQCSMWLSTFHDMQEHFESVLHSYTLTYSMTLGVHSPLEGNQRALFTVPISFCLGAPAVTSHVCWLIEGPPLSYPKGIHVVWEFVTLMPRSHCCLCWFFCAQPYVQFCPMQ